MKKIRPFLFLIISCLNSCIENNSDFPNHIDHSNYTLIAEQTSFSETLKNGEYLTEFGIRLELRPKQDSLPPIYFWTCAWPHYGFLDSGFQDYKYYFGSHGECDANFEIFTALNQNDILEITTVIGRNGHFEDFDNPKLRFGYQIVDTTEVSWNKKLFPDSTTSTKTDSLLQLDDHIVWSNTLPLNRMSTPISYGFDVAYPVRNVENFVFDVDSSIFTSIWFENNDSEDVYYLEFDSKSPHFKTNVRLLSEFKKVVIHEFLTSAKNYCRIIGTLSENGKSSIKEVYLITYSQRGVFDCRLVGKLNSGDSANVLSKITNDSITVYNKNETINFMINRDGKISLTGVKNP